MGAMNLGWCEKSASMIMTKFPVANCRVYVGSPKTEFPSAGADLDTLRGVDFLELSSDFLSAIRRAIVDNNEFPLEVTVKCLFSIEGRARWLQGWTNCSVKVLFSRCYYW